ncbi:MAG: T9SS type A sorting domain-containing protein, partial [Chitinophagaceae bacterium]
HCAGQGLTFDINNPQITAAFKVCNPRSISFSIKNNGIASLTEHFVLYKDDGDGIFEPFAGQDGPAIYTYTPDTILAPSGTHSRTQFAYPGSATPGESASLWLEVVVPLTGYTTVAYISHIANGCSSLPVEFKFFTATRNHSNVILKWETLGEQNSRGFAIDRNINGTWDEISFVASQAPGGNSSDLLSYQFVDVNNAKGISQYRLRQVDFNNSEKFSEIRSVRGESQIGKIIVYPNPTLDGKVNVSFEDASVIRDVSLIDMTGRMIKQLKAVTSNSITIDNLTPGMYTLRVVVPETGEQTVEKIVVNKR